MQKKTVLPPKPTPALDIPPPAIVEEVKPAADVKCFEFELLESGYFNVFYGPKGKTELVMGNVSPSQAYVKAADTLNLLVSRGKLP